MDPLSLTSLGAVGLGYAVKFLFDRGNAALDRRAQRRSADASVSTSGPVTEPTRNTVQDSGQRDVVETDNRDKAAAEAEVAGAMRVLEVYREKQLALKPEDAVLLDTIQRLHAAIERLEGAPVDLDQAVRSLIEVNQAADHVRGTMTGADLGEPTPGTEAHIVQKIGTLHEGGSVTGFRSGDRR
ncbi:hypothetical protein NQK81_05875 [Amycolatopsis roodepoortensis]|uniref:hypothetical protein n=1 Tax=Amycolatopsis roodepoortensis TaxID=700274 RepID=UPI00214C6652|nr:hypothetical protein [Amycolatopsis roodepoortensis]UUV32980.1 hypothetical protein NQK81_05875 [Amycolatopsis roodepoortensis]